MSSICCPHVMCRWVCYQRPLQIMCVLYTYAQIICGWHLNMQITCEQCLDAICRENHQHRLSCKSFIWSWNETTQHFCDKFYSITNSCHWKDSWELRWPWGVLQTMCGWPTCLQMTCGWCMDDVCHQPTKSLYDMYMYGQHLNIIHNMRFCVHNVQKVNYTW